MSWLLRPSLGRLRAQFWTTHGYFPAKDRIRRRRQWCRIIWLLVSVLVLVLGCVTFVLMRYTGLSRTEFVRRIIGPHPIPPLYPNFRKAESQLPQHAHKGPIYAGQKYLWVASHTERELSDLHMTMMCRSQLGRIWMGKLHAGHDYDGLHDLRDRKDVSAPTVLCCKRTL